MKTNRSITALLGSVCCVALLSPAFAQAPVKTVPVQQRDIASYKTFVGTVRPTRHAILGSAVDGRVIEFNFEEGDRVEDGDAIAQLLTNTIGLQRDAAAAELSVREAELAELKNGTRIEEVEQMKARMLAAEARQRYLDLRRERAVELYEKRGVTSKEVHDEAVSAADAAAQEFMDAKKAYELSVAGPRPEQIAQAEARVAMQKAIVQELEDRINKYTIRTRFTGYIVKKSTEVGAWANSGGAVAEVAQLDQVDVVANVPEQDIPYVQIGREVEVEVFAYPGRKFPGKVLSVIPQADIRARTFPVKVRVANEFDQDQPVLKGGMMGNVMLQTSKTKTALLVPKDSVVLNGASKVVYVVSPSENGQIARPVPVTLGVSDGSDIEVTGELKPGMQVVTHGNERLRPGQPVTILPSAQTAGR
ncbi:efflux RND transporter periplasmic adaptor subunit [Bremerella sp. T1]|uniref:efflux RND transporter periplasmic adaptor subunit n=1 Tax=Bremerella sp. TYQ1 TaxID=3119568 RepID=UPI001CCF437E|nr:efflux RND transporter periplasmic adaptor subunit [Bremerella volcania]UBM37574.1 efflux RND transporter periplasmic adaptor subunit [Bremerella volcania]